jgi:hypothetical protein
VRFLVAAAGFLLVVIGLLPFFSTSAVHCMRVLLCSCVSLEIQAEGVMTLRESRVSAFPRHATPLLVLGGLAAFGTAFAVNQAILRVAPALVLPVVVVTYLAAAALMLTVGNAVANRRPIRLWPLVLGTSAFFFCVVSGGVLFDRVLGETLPANTAGFLRQLLSFIPDAALLALLLWTQVAPSVRTLLRQDGRDADDGNRR